MKKYLNFVCIDDGEKEDGLDTPSEGDTPDGKRPKPGKTGDEKGER